MAQIQSLSHRHDAIIDWLIVNPEKSLGECAAFFGYTQCWLSQVIHSDVFQMVYQQRAAERSAVATHSVVSKMVGIAALGLEQLHTKMEAGKLSERGVLDATKLALGGLGYINGENPGVQFHQHQHLHVDGEELRLARERILRQRRGTTSGKVGDEPEEVSVQCP